jgi:hypothetical protein
MEHHVEQRRWQNKEAEAEMNGAESRKYFKACMRPPCIYSWSGSQCLFLVRRQRNGRSSLRSCRYYIAPQIASEVKEIQRPAKMTFNQNELRVTMRLLVC